MRIRLSEVIAFATGVAIGAVATYKVVSNRYEQIIEAMYDRFDADDAEDEEEDEIITVAEHNAIDDMKNIYNNIAQNAGYTEKEETYVPGPYVISPDDFDTLDGYTTESLNHYACGTVTDQFDDIIEDPEDLIGDINPTDYYGRYEDDSVYVRNDVTKCDYEILRDTRTYEEANDPNSDN